jgi:formylglycine-generating enzyme required for sulfatase activity
MAKYPITYAQFQVFLDAKDGFKDDRCWRGLAHQEKRAGKQTWKVANHPRETVSWYAAVAFCNWLSQRVGYEIRLPTEWEWQWAAQGPDGRQYPWGKEFLKGYANIDERRIRGGDFSLQQTTPVDRYPQGASPFGVLDMAGNVWEWCLNEYDTPANIATTGNALRAQRGGSFSDYARLWQCKFRFNREPGNRYGLIGFRIVFSPFFYPNSGL